MGSAISRVTNFVTRPIKEYNLYERAHNAVIKNKYVPSPKHPSTQEIIQKSINELPPEVKKNLSSTDPFLQERLRQVYVTSPDVTTLQPLPRQHPNRPLPLDRGYYKTPEYGYFEPKITPYGKVTLKTALQFITAHQNDPGINTVDSIALKHKLDQRLTEQVLLHFGTFRLFVPSEQTASQQELLKKLKATPIGIPNTKDLQRQLQAITVINTDHETVPLYQLQERKTEQPGPTLLKPVPTEGPYCQKELDTSAKDEGMDQYTVQAQAVPLRDVVNDCVTGSSYDAVRENKGGVPSQSTDEVTRAKSYVPLEKDKNADAT